MEPTPGRDSEGIFYSTKPYMDSMTPVAQRPCEGSQAFQRLDSIANKSRRVATHETPIAEK